MLYQLSYSSEDADYRLRLPAGPNRHNRGGALPEPLGPGGRGAFSALIPMLANAALILPDFALIALGFVLFHRFGYERSFWIGLERLVYFLLFPALLFNSIVSAKYSLADDGGLLVAGVGGLLVGAGGARGVPNARATPARGPEQVEARPTRDHKNSRDFDGETHVYVVRKPDGTPHKIGESAQGTRLKDGASRRAEKQVRTLNRQEASGHTSEIRKTFPTKDAARAYETKLIERFRSRYGQDTLPGNKTNR